ncbi:Uncharacterised protein [Mycobacteroides abscessus subsp. bolletii]|nr:Uncharacterised protein [Mycobacteroides abscessus subsp. bolletii]SKX00372.1 Uncharacterised protein [Mycobacteroides abscessus subsp. bolletii]
MWSGAIGECHVSHFLQGANFRYARVFWAHRYKQFGRDLICTEHSCSDIGTDELLLSSRFAKVRDNAVRELTGVGG